MPLLVKVRSFVRNLFLTRHVEKDFEQEIVSHLELLIEENIRAGMRPKEAKRAAQIEFGGIEQVKEQVRDRRIGNWLRSVLSDCRFGLRQLRKNPGFTTVAVLTLALGIGANTTVFSWIRSVLLNPLPGAVAPDRVVALETIAPNGDWVPSSYLDFRDVRASSKLLQSMCVAKPVALAIGNDNAVEQVWGEVVSGSFFELLRVEPELGRFFSSLEVDHEQNTHSLAIISHSYWNSHLHTDPLVIGSKVRINHFPYTIIGVAPEIFHGSMPGLSFDMWVPATMYGQLTSTGNQTLLDRKWRTFRVLARLAPGVSINQARAEVQSNSIAIAHENLDTNEGMSATLLPLWKAHYGIQVSLIGPLSILMATCGVLLLIVCANVSNLSLARATTRQREFSIRVALGAPRSRLIRQLLTESLLISLAGALAGLGLAARLAGLLGYLLPHSSSPTLARAPLDAAVLLFMVTMACGAAMLAGLAPALHTWRENVNDSLKEGGRTGSSARSVRLLGLFVTSEMALAIVALITAGLFVKTFRHVSEVRPGFDPKHVVIAQLNLSAASYDAQQADSFCVRLREQLESQPGVTAVSYADYVPLSVSAGSWEDLQIKGYLASPSENMKIYRALVAPGYFDLMKISILQGRDFNLRDDMTAPPAMIVNQEFVRRFTPNGIAIGRQIRGWGRWFTVVGVVSDSKIYRLTEPPTPYFYVPIRQIYRPEMGLVFYVRTLASIDSATMTLRREAQAADPLVPVFGASSLDESIAASLFSQRISAGLLSVLGSVALLLAAVGLYGVMSYSVAQRTNEIGIRVALGAQSGDISRLVLGKGARLAATGIITGALAALALTGLLSSLLFGVSTSDPWIFVATAMLLTFVALVASYLPARRAARVDPMIALRYG
jgi:predicted permease